MASTAAMFDRVEDFTREKEESASQGKTTEELISELNQELYKYKDIRKEVNRLKEQKDKLILKYIESVEQPYVLDLELINYKALYFYFKANFIEPKKKFLSFENYKNDLGQIQKGKSSAFEEAFDADKRIYLDIKETNFPHLIGYKTDDKDEFGNYDNTKNRDFLNSIYYETNLIEDYSDHGCDLKKIKCLSWIWRTLNKPLYVFMQDGLKVGKSYLNTDLLFVKKVKDTYHYVSLVKIDGSSKNKYVINSHHPMTQDEFRIKYYTNKAIYKFDFR